jgi:hypothetical protein
MLDALNRQLLRQLGRVLPVGNVFSTLIVSPMSTVANVSFWAVVSIRNLVATDV